jgi:hypothetical protein
MLLIVSNGLYTVNVCSRSRTLLLTQLLKHDRQQYSTVPFSSKILL